MRSVGEGLGVVKAMFRRSICHQALLLLFVPGMKQKQIIKLCDDVDHVTHDMIVGILGGEEGHRREFIGFLTDYEKK